MNTVFCFGWSYTAQALARHRAASAWRFAATSRQTPSPGAPTEARMHRFARNAPLQAPEHALAGATHVLISVPPDEDGCAVADRHAGDLAALPDLAWVGYLSTTGVYGDRAGAWVDEAAAPAPAQPRSRHRRKAELDWLDHWRRRGLPVHIFRVAGIYGPGRSAIEQVRSGQARRLTKAGQVFSRIHVDDLAAALAASMARPRPGAIYNVADDAPSSTSDVVAGAAALLGLEPPPERIFDPATAGPMLAEFYAECRRVANRRLKRELALTLRYPSWREGLAAIVRGA